MRPLIVPLLLLAATLAAVPSQADHVAVADIVLDVDGTPAHGLIALPHGAPHTLVVVTHGYTHQAESHRGHLEALADLGAAAIAMDYRGPEDGFPLGAGAADTIAATEHLRGMYPAVDRVVLFSVSMGAAVGAMTLAALPDTFDWWVASEPMANWIETWAEAKALAPANDYAAGAVVGIEAECGGTPLDAPDCYLERAAVARVPEIQGLSGAVVLHGLNDGLVPYDQGRELAQALRAHGVRTDFTTVLRGESGAGGTTITGYGGLDPDGLAGHGTESNDTHTLTRLSWEATHALVSGAPGAEPSDREFVWDRETGRVP